MIPQLHAGRGFLRSAARTIGLAALAFCLVAGVSGCRHRNTPVTFPQIAHAPVELETPPMVPLMVAELPMPELGPLPPPPAPAPPPRRRPATAPKEESQPPTQVAEAGPAELAIGSLSTGGDVTPEVQQQAQEMIASLLKRIAGLPAKTAEAQRRQIRQVRHFLDQAQQALSSGDAEGARNLATKARQLMDDLQKR